MKTNKSGELLKTLFKDRPRTNILKNHEQQAIFWLVKRIPGWIGPNFLTGVGLFGNIVVSTSFILASIFDRTWLLFGLVGFLISWFGDSLDGRLAYYRNRPRKNFGFTLDITIDWISVIIIGFGYIIYAEGPWELLGYGFVVMYGWEMILVLIHYRLTNEYLIDSGKLGPTEVRILISAVMITEVFVPGSLKYLAAFVVLALFTVNIIDTHKLLKEADGIDNKEQNP